MFSRCVEQQQQQQQLKGVAVKSEDGKPGLLLPPAYQAPQPPPFAAGQGEVPYALYCFGCLQVRCVMVGRGWERRSWEPRWQQPKLHGGPAACSWRACCAASACLLQGPSARSANRVGRVQRSAAPSSWAPPSNRPVPCATSGVKTRPAASAGCCALTWVGRAPPPPRCTVAPPPSAPPAGPCAPQRLGAAAGGGRGGARAGCRRAPPPMVLQCPRCTQLFCFECDAYVHEQLHNCPGCECRQSVRRGEGGEEGEAEGGRFGEGAVFM